MVLLLIGIMFYQALNSHFLMFKLTGNIIDWNVYIESEKCFRKAHEEMFKN